MHCYSFNVIRVIRCGDYIESMPTKNEKIQAILWMIAKGKDADYIVSKVNNMDLLNELESRGIISMTRREFGAGFIAIQKGARFNSEYNPS